jgi:RNA-directed DNA polymerase
VGFDFLGCTIRQYPVGKYVSRKLYATLINPSKKAIDRHYRALAAPIERMKAATIDEVIRTLNPQMVGWSNYFRTQVSKKAFHRLDDLLWPKRLGWAKRQHNKQSTTGIWEKYFKPYGKCQHHRMMGKTHILQWHDETTITRHLPLRVKTSPYEGNWSYWGTRKGAYSGRDTARGKRLQHQGGRWAPCPLSFTVDDKTEVHHEDGNRKHNRFNNLKLLHLVCHDQVHRNRSTEECPHAKSAITEEPCARKLASTVLETSREG